MTEGPAEGSSVIAKITIEAYGQTEAISIIRFGNGPFHHREPRAINQAFADGENILSTLDRMRKKAGIDD